MYKKIIIIGGSGSGKSTLAKRISTYTNYPVYHLDNLLLKSNWETKDKSEWEEISKQFLSKDCGIVDGNYSSALPNRIQWADLIIFSDVSTITALYRVFRRYFRIKLGLESRHGHPQESRERLRMTFVLWVYNWNRSHREKIFSMLKSVQNKKVIITRNPNQLDLTKLFKHDGY